MKSISEYEAMASLLDGPGAGGTGDGAPTGGEAVEVLDGSEYAQGLVAQALGRTAPKVPRKLHGAAVKESHTFGGGRFDVTRNGVYFVAVDDEGNEKGPLFLCSELGIKAETRDSRSNAWGRLLRWKDSDGVEHQWALPMDLLEGDGLEFRKELARQGLAISASKKARDWLAQYIKLFPVNARARCVERLGWVGCVYVTGNQAFGQGSEIVVFQNAHAIEPAFAQAGTLAQWRKEVAALAAGNTRMVFAVSVALAGVLCELAGEDSGGFHLRGGTSTGKTTALRLAASVWGNPREFVRLWRATANGLEGLAALHNDGLLILDELGQIDPKDAGEAAYMLANGQGKTRAGRTGTARAAQQWRLLFLSSGELSLSDLMAGAGKKTKAGQEIRLADIAADAGVGLGAFESLHHFPSAAALSTALRDGADKCHGTAGLEWLHKVVQARGDGLSEVIADGVKAFCAEAVPNAATGAVHRVARRFGLVAVAGELATTYGITGWNSNEAYVAALACFRAWLEGFGGAGDKEDRQLLAQVRAFFEAHGASRFEDADQDEASRVQPRTINRVGFYRVGADGVRRYLVLPEAFRRELCAGFDAKWAAAALVRAGWIEPEGDKAQQRARLPELGRVRVYAFTAQVWGGEQ